MRRFNPLVPPALQSLFSTFLLLITGCASVAPPPPTQFTQRVSVSVPLLIPLAQTSAAQTKGGVSLSLTPIIGEIRRGLQCRYTPHQAMVLIMPAGASKSTHQLYREARFEAPIATGGPVALRFTVRNDMERVFRGAGAVLQFSIDGQARPAAQEAYVDFLNTIILPREQREIVVRDRTIANVQPSGRFGVFMYDVVTRTDAAGNVQARDNFEWYFSATRRDSSETVSALPRTVWIKNDDARAINSSPGQVTECFEGVYPKDNY